MKFFCRTFAAAVALFFLFACSAEEHAREGAVQWPYDEQANASADVQQAITEASAEDKLVMLVFGANWCPDCRALDAAMRDEEIASLIEERFRLVRIDVGNWDKHLELNEAWGDPIDGGIPALVVANADSEILYSTRTGELATARRMGRNDFYLYFAHLSEMQNRNAE